MIPTAKEQEERVSNIMRGVATDVAGQLIHARMESLYANEHLRGEQMWGFNQYAKEAFVRGALYAMSDWRTRVDL